MRSENHISPVSYHSCEYTVTRNVSKVVAFQKPYETIVPCRGWIPWKLCAKTHYKTQYHSIMVAETANITQCCDGYEQVGDYCALSLEKSSQFVLSHGMCPDINKEMKGKKNCTFDIDCPGLQKCCNFSKGSFCTSPAPQALDRNTIKYWYNGTVTIKMGFNELSRIDPGFFNHTRLLHSMISGELWPLNVTVHHISTKPAGTFTVESLILIGINESDSLINISSKLNNIVIRLPEVIDIQIKDLNECLHPRLHGCLKDERCIHLEGSYNCTQNSAPPTNSTDCSSFLNHGISNVTGSSFYIHWNTDCPENHTYNVQVFLVKRYNESSITISQTHLHIRGLAAGELYMVGVGFEDCRGIVHSWKEQVKTEAQILVGKLRIINLELTEDLRNTSSNQYKNFVNNFSKEIKESLPQELSPNNVKVEVYALSAGSVVVHYHLIISNLTNPINITSVTLSSTNKDNMFDIDQNSIVFTDFDECSSLSDNDCDVNAICKNLEGSYTCDCNKPYMDTNPSRPGRSCHLSGEEISPLPGLLNPTTKGPVSINTNSPPAQPFPTTVTTSYFTTVDSKPEDSTTVFQTLPSVLHTAVSSTVDHNTISLNTSDGQLIGKPVTSNPALQESLDTTHNIVSSTSYPSISSSTEIIPTMLPNSVSITSGHSTEHSSTQNVKTDGVNYTVNVKETETMSHVPRSTNQNVSHVTSTSPTVHTGFLNTTVHDSLKSLVTINNDLSMKGTPGKITTTISTLSLKDASIVLCDMEKIGIRIQKTYLNQMSISEGSLYLGNASCNVSDITDSYVQLQSGWNMCGTQVQNNKTHVILYTTLYMAVPQPFPNMLQPPKQIGSIHCLFQNDIVTSSGYNTPKGIYFTIEDLKGDGTIIPEFELFDGDQPISRNVTLAATDDITVHIRIRTDDVQFKVVISDCWATPSADVQDPLSASFINNSCALPNTHTLILSNGISNNASFQTKIFALIETPIVYLHCRLHICKEIPPGTCKPSCGNSARSLTAGEKVSTTVTRMGPLHRANKYNTQDSKEFTLGPGYIALIIILIFLFVAGVAAGFICWHERRTGKYNFKLKRDVGYQVFSN
ncbi:uromodulin-like 1 [Bombina bombina]|uniref:uromodulin-like 1 n=1 Tax=Bombina bombina TaxID=8345 RepID=UPI00235AF11B|nr:uromodulin-like 1 [Bombina bombina]